MRKTLGEHAASPRETVVSPRRNRPTLAGKFIISLGILLACVLSPPQKVLPGTLQPGDSWEWQANDVSSIIRANVIGASAVTVPAGTYSAIEIAFVTLSPTPYGTARVEQTCWFVPSVGWVKQATRALVETHLLTHVTLTLEKVEPVTAQKNVR
jgi:hypothetical protein